jgi:hypothetical protein
MNYTKKIIFIVILSSAIFLTGCATTSRQNINPNIQNINPIPITEGITTEEVINALINSADANPETKKRRRRGPISSYEDGRWIVQDATDNFVILVYTIGHHFVRVKYEIKKQEILPTVISSSLLRGKKGIHKNAVAWINRHGITICEAMWKVKHSKKTND